MSTVPSASTSTRSADQATDLEQPSSKRPRIEESKSDVEEEPKPNFRYLSPDADLILVSCDGDEFRVHSYQLMAASPVFRSMFALGHQHQAQNKDDEDQLRKITLTDTNLETFMGLANFLDLIHGRDLAEWTDDLPFEELWDLILLAQKYECAPALQVIQLAARYWLEKGINHHLHTFVLGCHLDDVSLCADAIRAAGGWTWCSQNKCSCSRLFHKRGTIRPPRKYTGRFNRDPFFESIRGRSVLDLTSLPWNYYCKIPDEFKFALLRVSVETENFKNDYEAFNAMGDEFEKLVGMLRSRKGDSVSK